MIKKRSIVYKSILILWIIQFVLFYNQKQLCATERFNESHTTVTIKVEHVNTERSLDHITLFFLFSQSLFSGIVLVICFLNLFVYVLSRDKIFLFYSLYTAVASSFFLFYNGFITLFIPTVPETIVDYLFFLVHLGMVLYAIFLFEAIKSENLNKWKNPIKNYTVFCCILFISLLIIASFNYEMAGIMGDIFAGLNGIFLVLLIFIMYKRVSNIIRIILIGSQFILIGGYTTLIADLFEYKVTHIYYYQIGFVIELIFFTIAVNFMHQKNRLVKIQSQLQNIQLQAAHSKKEEETKNLQQIIDLKNRNLTCKAISISQKEALINKVIKQLSSLQTRKYEEVNLSAIISDLRSSLHNSTWEEFEIHFNDVHPNFYKQLDNNYPSLTSNERKLCAYLKLNLSTKEITEITGKSQNTIDVARSRLRKKMLISSSTNLTSLLAALG